MNYRNLLNRVDDLRGLAMPPLPGERAGSMSSYDRASRYDEATGRYLDWAANDDGSGCIRTLPDGGIVAFECEGPGVIWRVWSALPERGPMRVYFDDEAAPRVDVPFLDWFEKTPDAIPPLNYSELSQRLSRGRNSYVPIPFRKRCRIELGKGWGAYYHFTYSTFPAGTELPDYGERFARENQIAMAELDRRLYDRGEAEREAEPVQATLAPGETRVVYACEGGGALAELAFDPSGLVQRDDALSRMVLELRWDGQQEPAVSAPLGDFFGSAPGYHRHSSLPVSMERGRYASRWFMPFSQGFTLSVTNGAAQSQTVRFALSVERDVPEPERLLRFHAKWHTNEWLDLPQADYAPGGMRWPDWPLLLASGTSGRFCGVHLHVYNAWREPATPAPAWWYGEWDKKNVDWWWGEGDEKFFIDGERFPSTFGTGSEDYIGYAWAAEPPFARFSGPFAAMSAMPIDGNGHTSVARYHIADNIPFQSGFQGFIEKYKPDDAPGARCRYAATAFWYQQADRPDGYPAARPAPFLDACTLD